MIKEIEIAWGAVPLGVGLSLLTGLPPNWWPEMPIYLVHAGLILSPILIIGGTLLLLVGGCRYATEHRFSSEIVSGWDRMWTTRRALAVGGLAIVAVALGPSFWPISKSAAAQSAQSPSYSQDCQPGAGCSQGQTGGQTVGTLNQYGPPHLPNRLYQNGQTIGSAETASIDKSHGTITLTNPKVSGGGIDFNAPFEFRGSDSLDYLIKCPSIQPSNPNSASVSIAVGGDIKCEIQK